MPRKGRKSKAAPVQDEEPAEVASTSTSHPEEIPQSVAEVATEVVSNVAETVKEAVDVQMDNATEAVSNVAEAASQFVETMNGDESMEPEAQTSESKTAPSMTPEERRKKMDELRKRMRDSAQANRSAVITEATTRKVNFRDTARLEKQRQLAEMLRSKAEAATDGKEGELERAKNWEYSIEENDAWEKRMKRKKGRSDFQFHNEEDQARKKYKKDLDLLQPDMVAYNRQKEIALGLPAGTLVKVTADEKGKEVATITPQQQLAASEALYRDANTLLYADNKPSEEAIDRVVSKINKDIDKRNKFSRKRDTGDDELITYINEKNRVFNKKIARYYDKYTEEIRASFERGTAL